MQTPHLYSCGSNASAQLSLSHSNDTHTLAPCAFHPSTTPLLPGSTILDLVSSSAHSLLLLRTPLNGGRNFLLGAGTNTLGQLGPRCALWDEVRPESRFKVVDLLGPVGMDAGGWEPVMVGAMWTTSVVVYQKRRVMDSGSGGSRVGGGGGSEEDGEVEQLVVTCGSNDFGELGMPSSMTSASTVPVTRPCDKPTIVDLGLAKGECIEHLKAGQRHAVAVVSRGHGQGRQQRMIGWGAARKGELDGATLGGSGGGGSSTAFTKKGKGKSVTRPSTLPPTPIDLQIPNGSHIVDLALGSAHSLALLSDGRVLAWGSDAKGQTAGLGETMQGIKQVGATWNGSYCLSEDGRLWSQGSDSHAQLLRGNQEEEIRLPEGLEVENLVCGSEHVLVVAARKNVGDERGALWAGGWNEHGNLGLGDTEDRPRLCEVELPSGGGRVKRVWGGCAASWVELENDT